MEKSIILVGNKKTATTSIVRFFYEFDIRSVHEQLAPRLGKEYDYDAKIERMKRTYQQFEASWPMSYFMLEMSKRVPEIQWLIMLRDPKDCCNSIRATGVGLKNMVTGEDIIDEELSWNTIIKRWRALHASLIKQIPQMVERPRWMEFEGYISGVYNERLLDLFDIERSEKNLNWANEILKRKYRSSGKKSSLDYNRFDKLRDLNTKIKSLCEAF